MLRLPAGVDAASRGLTSARPGCRNRLRQPGPGRQDGAVSVLEFIAAIKWPITVLILAGVAALALRRSPRTRGSMGTWLRERNLRLNVAGQEFEATLAATRGSMGVAAENDSNLAAAVADAIEPSEAAVEQTQETVEAARRAAVETVLRSGVRLGWQLAKSGTSAPPAVEVHWTDAGTPIFSVDPGQQGFNFRRDRHDSPAPNTESASRAAGRALIRWINEHNDALVNDQDRAMRTLLDRLQANRARGEDGDSGVEVGDTNPG